MEKGGHTGQGCSRRACQRQGPSAAARSPSPAQRPRTAAARCSACLRPLCHMRPSPRRAAATAQPGCPRVVATACLLSGPPAQEKHCCGRCFSTGCTLIKDSRKGKRSAPPAGRSCQSSPLAGAAHAWFRQSRTLRGRAGSCVHMLEKPKQLASRPYQHKRLSPQLPVGHTAALMQLHALASFRAIFSLSPTRAACSDSSSSQLH